MRLVIAEKPSVAMNLAKVLGAGARRDGYTEGGGWLVSWCVGHLVDLANADAYDPRYSNACVKNVFEIWQESTPTRGAQLVFCDRVAIRCYK